MDGQGIHVVVRLLLVDIIEWIKNNVFIFCYPVASLDDRFMRKET
jgi:hypothetical protein